MYTEMEKKNKEKRREVEQVEDKKREGSTQRSCRSSLVYTFSLWLIFKAVFIHYARLYNHSHVTTH